MKQPYATADRFWPKVDKRGHDECWPWIAHVSSSGYGRFFVYGKGVTTAHRAAYELVHGVALQPDTEVDHLCHNRACVNPAHLEAVDHAENMRRTRAALAEKCARGHTFTDYRSPSHGRRECQECRRDRERRRVR